MAEEKKKEKAKKTFAPYQEAKKRCPKCQSRLAEHKDRFACGKCGYTEFIKQEKK